MEENMEIEAGRYDLEIQESQKESPLGPILTSIPINHEIWAQNDSNEKLFSIACNESITYDGDPNDVLDHKNIDVNKSANQVNAIIFFQVNIIEDLHDEKGLYFCTFCITKSLMGYGYLSMLNSNVCE